MKYAKTDVGQQAFKERSPTLSAKQRSAFILFDGAKSLADVLAATGCAPADADHLLAHGYIAAAPGSAPAVAAAAPAGGGSGRTPQQCYAEAYPLATKLTASLGLRGFKLNLAVEAAAGYEDLLALLPRIQEAVGHEVSLPLERALKA